MAQPTIDPRSAGTTYLFAIPDTTRNLYDSRQDTDPRFVKREPQNDSVFVTIYSAVDNDVRITGYGGYSTQVTVQAGTVQTVYLSGKTLASAPIVEESGAVSDKTFRIEATNPIVVYCFVVTKFAAEAFTPAPVESWGTEYYAAALPGEVLYDEIPGGENNYIKVPKAGPAEILVIAAFDNTRVTIVPNARLDRNPPTTVTLMKGQCYQVQSYVDTNSFNLGNPQPDIGGSYIYATRPIGVISGNTRAQVLDNNGGLAKNSFKNMMIEWLPPTDQHGTKFVYLPTWDDWRPTGAPDENPDTKRPGEVIRVYATAGKPDDDLPTTTSVSDIEGSGGNVVNTLKVERTKFFATLTDGKTPHVFTTDRPAQAFMSSVATVRFMGTTGSGNFVGSSYNGLATYMVELVPEERWTWTAPFIAPVHPPKMNHYLNIVTDSSSRNKITINGAQALINRPIAGTPYYWGARTLNRGESGVIQGTDSTVRFYAMVYGAMLGTETYRPGKTRKNGDGSETGGATDRRRSGMNNQVLHPSEYEENIGLMYGYPVAPSHLALRPGDSLSIVTSYDCGTLHITATAVSADPVGLSSIRLDSADNAQLSFIDPGSSDDVVGRTSAELSVAPVQPSKPASGVVVIRDRSGKISRVRYEWTPSETNVPVITPGKTLDFEESGSGIRATKQVVVRNGIEAPLSVVAARLLNGANGFRIDSTRPALPTTIAPGDSLTIFISFAADEARTYQDDLRIDYNCSFSQVALNAEAPEPCLTMDDIDFGTLKSGTFAAMPLRICNRGRGWVTFEDPLITGLTRTFQVSAADLDLLKKTRLGPGDCVTIAVLFHGERADQYRTTARFWASTRKCRDTSVWSARVVPDVLGVEESDAAGQYTLVAVEPNPLTATTTITFRLGAAGRTTVEIYDAAGSRVASLADGMLEAGRHVLPWSAGDLPSGIYYCRIRSGVWSVTQPLLLVR